MGEEFMRTIADTRFSEAKRFPRSRQAFIAMNLVSPKVVEGIGKLLAESDIAKLAGKEKLLELEAAEECFEEAWALSLIL